MTDFKSGDMVAVKVDVTAKVVYQNSDGSLDLVFPGGNDIEYFPREFVTHADPESWPPQVGDIWEAGGHEYAVRQYSARPGVVRIDPLEYFAGSGARLNLRDYDGEEHATFKTLNPVLVRRRENG